jgi:hypothetical protein
MNKAYEIAAEWAKSATYEVSTYAAAV